MSLEHPSLFEFPNHRPIDLYSFKIPGLGNAGPNCGAQRLSDYSRAGDKVRYSPLRCKRIECPECWTDWVKRTVFDIAMKIEAHAISTGTRPYDALMSVPPAMVDGEWDWERVNTSLFHRGYRRIKECGVKGGVVAFHPYRIKKVIQVEFRASGVHRDVGMWKIIRKRVQDGDNLYDYVDLGPHVHGIVFGEPSEHRSPDYLIRFNDKGNDGRPKELNLRDIVGYLFYLLTHTGVLNHMAGYKKHHSVGDEDSIKVRKRVTHPIRSFGSLFRVKAEELLSVDVYNELARRVAKMVGMVWGFDGELRYPASCKEFDLSDEGVDWVPIHQLYGLINDIDQFNRLSGTQQRFWLDVWEFMMDHGRPPDPDEVVAPADIEVFIVDGVSVEAVP